MVWTCKVEADVDEHLVVEVDGTEWMMYWEDLENENVLVYGAVGRHTTSQGSQSSWHSQYIANTWYAAIFPPAQGRRLSWPENTVTVHYQLVFDMLVECPPLFDGLNLIQCDMNSCVWMPSLIAPMTVNWTWVCTSLCLKYHPLDLLSWLFGLLLS